jgi:hypothetical protein
MTIFLLAVFPLALLMSFLQGGSKALRFSAVITGLIFGVLACGVQALFFFPSRTTPSDFFPLFFNTFFLAMLLPATLLGALFFLLFKGDASSKVRAYFFVQGSFFVIMLPYRLLSGVFPLGYYELHVVPLMYAIMTYAVSLLVQCFYGALVNPPALDEEHPNAKAQHALILIAISLCLLCEMALPAAAVAARATGSKAWGILTGVFFVYSVCVAVPIRGQGQENH